MGDRLALGRAVLQRIGESFSKPVFIAATRYEFEADMIDEHSPHSGLFRSKSVSCTLAAIDCADCSEALEGRERLAALQNLIVDLLSYLENEEGFRVHFGERGRATMATEPADASSQDFKDVRILHQTRGRIRLRITRLRGDNAYASRLQSVLQTLDHVKSVRVNIDAACVVVEYSAVQDAEFVQKVVALVENDINGGSVSDKLHTRESSPPNGTACGAIEAIASELSPSTGTAGGAIQTFAT
jgi:hypothetical protein